MAVAKDQIKELLVMTLQYIPPKDLLNLLFLYRRSEAYKRNKSFKATVDRMMKELK